MSSYRKLSPPRSGIWDQHWRRNYSQQQHFPKVGPLLFSLFFLVLVDSSLCCTSEATAVYLHSSAFTDNCKNSDSVVKKTDELLQGDFFSVEEKKMKGLFVLLWLQHKLRGRRCVVLFLGLWSASFLAYSLVRWLMLHIWHEAQSPICRAFKFCGDRNL